MPVVGSACASGDRESVRLSQSGWVGRVGVSGSLESVGCQRSCRVRSLGRVGESRSGRVSHADVGCQRSGRSRDLVGELSQAALRMR